MIFADGVGVFLPAPWALRLVLSLYELCKLNFKHMPTLWILTDKFHRRRGHRFIVKGCPKMVQRSRRDKM